MPSSKVGLEFLHHISIPNEIIELSQKVAEVSHKVRSWVKNVKKCENIRIKKLGENFFIH